MITDTNPRGAGAKKMYINGTEPFITTIPTGSKADVKKAIEKIRLNYLAIDKNNAIINAKANGLIK